VCIQGVSTVRTFLNYTALLTAALALATGCTNELELNTVTDPVGAQVIPEGDEGPKVEDEVEPPLEEEDPIPPPVVEEEEDPVDTPVDPVQPPVEPPAPIIDEDLLSHLPKGDAQLDTLCDRGNDNAVTRALCTTPRPNIGSLADLQAALGMEFVDIRPGQNGRNGNPSFAMTGHSSSLVAKSVSPLNPRTIVFNRDRNDRDDNEFVAMGFTRGDQFAELMTFTEPQNNEPGVMTFYLFQYERSCDDNEGGCNNAEKLLPETESGWQRYTVYEDVDLKNSVLDCLHCHQPNGPGTQKILRMQELQDPWTHWFRDNRDGGQTMIADFQSSHGTDETYGGIPAVMIEDADPADLEDFVRNAGFGNQPNEFLTEDIEDELAQDGLSQTWEGLYDNAVQGLVIPPPFYDVQIQDPAKFSDLSQAYAQAKAGTLPGDQMPDIRDTVADEYKSFLSQRPKPGLDGQGILVHMCAQCHNPNLDQNISRARFDVMNLDSMSREEKDVAIERLLMPRNSRFAMPPAFFRDMSQVEIDLAVEVLSQ
jgi:hypothetical protein